MSKFYMHIRDGNKLIEDLEGQDFPDAAAASADARQAAREMLSDKVKLGEVVNGQRIEIHDDAGNLLEIVRFKDQMTFPAA